MFLFDTCANQMSDGLLACVHVCVQVCPAALGVTADPQCVAAGQRFLPLHGCPELQPPGGPGHHPQVEVVTGGHAACPARCVAKRCITGTRRSRPADVIFRLEAIHFSVRLMQVLVGGGLPGN